MAVITSLGSGGYPRGHGSYAGKSAGTTQPHPAGHYSVLGPGGYPRPPYGAFSGKAAGLVTVHAPVGGSGRRFRETTSYNRDKQKWEFLLEEIRDDEAVPTKAKTAVKAVKRAKRVALEVVETRDLEAAQVEHLAQLYEAARSAAKAAQAIEAANEAIRFAQALMDEEDEDEIMILLGLLH